MAGLWTPPRPAFHPAVLARGSGPLWFTEIALATADWRELRRIRIATCPYLNCKHYTSVFTVNVDGSIGKPIVGWLGSVKDGLTIGDYWWDEQPWCWFVTSFLTSGAGTGNQTYTSDLDWNNANNFVELLAAGASGGAAANTIANDEISSGGGGGAYQKHTNFSFATPGTTTATYNLGAGGSAVTAGVGVGTPGNAGGDVYFDGTTYANSTIGAKGGSAGNTTLIGTCDGGAGGLASSGIGNATAYNGGTAPGNSIVGGGSLASSGGGGAAGPFGAGNNSASSSSGSAGGSGDAGTGGAGGPAGNGVSAGNGIAGTEWDSSHGSGGGGGGCSSNMGIVNPALGGNGGLYGAGGGSASQRSNSATAQSGSGRQALIVLSYIPPFTGFSGRPVGLRYLRR